MASITAPLIKDSATPEMAHQITFTKQGAVVRIQIEAAEDKARRVDILTEDMNEIAKFFAHGNFDHNTTQAAKLKSDSWNSYPEGVITFCSNGKYDLNIVDIVIELNPMRQMQIHKDDMLAVAQFFCND